MAKCWTRLIKYLGNGVAAPSGKCSRLFLACSFSFSMQLPWEDWGVLLWPGCCRQESEFECPWRIHRGRSVCELYKPHERHKLRDLRGRLLQTWRGTRAFRCHFTVELAAQSPSSAQGAELSKRHHCRQVNSEFWQWSRCFSQLEIHKVKAHRNRKANCVDTEGCTWGQGLQLVSQFALKKGMVL